MGARIGDRFDQLVDDMLGRRLVRIAHAEIDDILAGGPGARLHCVDLVENVRRQALYSMEFLDHVAPPRGAASRPPGWPRGASVLL